MVTRRISRSPTINRHILKGRWSQIKGRVRVLRGRLFDDRLDRFQGKVEVLKGRLQESYGRSRGKFKRGLDRELKRWQGSRRLRKLG